MSVSEAFRDNVVKGDPFVVRAALANYLIIDRSYKIFDEACNYASVQMGPEVLFQPFDGKPLIADPSCWTRDYLNGQFFALQLNFSPERIKHVKEVIPVALPEQNTPTEAVSSGIVQSSSSQGVSKGTANGRTGRRIIGESEVTPDSSSGKSNSSNGKTGCMIIGETEVPSSSSPEKKSSGVDIGTVLIAAGAATLTVGLLVTEPAAVVAGVAVTGAGCAAKVFKHSQNNG